MRVQHARQRREGTHGARGLAAGTSPAGAAAAPASTVPAGWWTVTRATGQAGLAQRGDGARRFVEHGRSAPRRRPRDLRPPVASPGPRGRRRRPPRRSRTSSDHAVTGTWPARATSVLTAATASSTVAGSPVTRTSPAASGTTAVAASGRRDIGHAEVGHRLAVLQAPHLVAEHAHAHQVRRLGQRPELVVARGACRPRSGRRLRPRRNSWVTSSRASPSRLG